MYVTFDTMPETARIWVYVSNKAFTPEQESEISDILHHFCSGWKRHGEDLKSSYTIKYQQFIILAVDESYQDISGCAINKSIKLMQQLEEKFHIELLNRLNTAFINETRVNVVDFTEFKELAYQKIIHSDTIVFNNLVSSKGALTREWETKAGQSWHARFLN